MVYIKNKNNETNRKINIICDPPKWEAQLHNGIENFYKEDQKFRIRHASQSSTQVLSLEEDLRQRFPHLNVKRLTGMDSGMAKKEYFEDINNTIEGTMVFIFTPVIE